GNAEPDTGHELSGVRPPRRTRAVIVTDPEMIIRRQVDAPGKMHRIADLERNEPDLVWIRDSKLADSLDESPVFGAQHAAFATRADSHHSAHDDRESDKPFEHSPRPKPPGPTHCT